MKTRNKRAKRKTRKMKGGGILFDGVWKSEPGISGERLTYSNAEAGAMNILHPTVMQNHETLAFFDNIDEVRERFLALYRGGESQEEMRSMGYQDMLTVIYYLNTAVESRTKMDRTFETIDSIPAIDDRGREYQRPISPEEKARHRHRTSVLAKLLKALREARKPYDEIYESFVKPKEEKEIKKFTFSDLPEGDELPEDTGPYVPSAPPRTPVRVATATEEEIDAFMEKCRAEKPSCDNCGKTDVPLLACSRCKSVRYCSPVCQKQHWPIHKPDCISTTEMYEVGSFPFHLERVHTVNVGGTYFVVSTEKEVLSFTTNGDRCMGPFQTIINTAEDVDYIMSVRERLKDMENKEEILKRGLQAYKIQFSKNPESKETRDAYRICNELKKRMAVIELELSELLTSHQTRTPIDWTAQREAILSRTRDITTELKTKPDAKLEDELAYLKTEILKIQKVLDISYPVSGLAMMDRHFVVSTENSIYFELDRTRIGGEAGFVDGPFHLARFHNPTDMEWMTPAQLCIVDTGNNAIRLLNNSRKQVDTFFERHQYKGQPYTLNHPMGVAGTKNPGEIVVADTGNHCITIINIQKIREKNVTKLTVIGEPGKHGWRDGSSCLFNRPESVCVYKGSIFVADTGNHCIRRLFVKDGVYHSETIAGTPREAGYKNGKRSLFSSPCKVTMMGEFIVIADRDNDKVRIAGTTLPCIKGL